MDDVVWGYEIASGKNFDSGFPKGAISMQLASFKDRGLDLSGFYFETLNIDITPYCYRFIKAFFCFEEIKWSNDLPPETFSFYPYKIFFTRSKLLSFKFRILASSLDEAKISPKRMSFRNFGSPLKVSFLLK